ncbi:MAG: ABC-F family ATP-binding cassette domain-containing protein [Clostridiales bacterium]|nr:ABC-F family ATP-binding cassette domain-containing protein [Clostridiales bacterium]
MIIFSASGVCLSFGTDVILDNISLGVNEGDKIGVVGVNGAGKSVFLKILTGKTERTAGEVYLSYGKTVGFLEQDTGLNSENEIYSEMLYAFPELVETEKRLAELVEKLNDKNLPQDEHMALAGKYTSLEEKFKENGGYEYKSRISSMLEALGFEKEKHKMKVNEFSGGQKTRLALSRLLLSEPDVLILDEPTNHLDIESAEWLENYLIQYKKSIIVVSHDRYFLDKVTNKTFEIENKCGKLYNCPYTEYVKRKEEDRKNDLKHYEIQQKEIARLEAFVENQRRWNRERNIIAAESRLKAIGRMEKLDKPKNLPSSIKFGFDTDSSVKTPFIILEVSDLKKSYPGKDLFDNLSFTVHGKDRMFVLGKNGIGKSTLLKILCGRVDADSGRFEYASDLDIGYYDQEQQGLNNENTVIDELWDCYPDKTQTEIRNALASFLFTADDVFKNVKVLSGGEKARLTFAKLMLQRSDMLILDEPTNHLDAPSREALEKALLDYKGTILCVSHDRYFINKLATRILDMRENGCFDYKGGYESYLEHKDRLLPEYNAQKPDGSDNIQKGKAEYIKGKEEKSRARKLGKQIEDTEKRIAELEAELSENEKLQEENASDYVKVGELFERYGKIREELDELYEKLEQLL